MRKYYVLANFVAMVHGIVIVFFWLPILGGIFDIKLSIWYNISIVIMITIQIFYLFKYRTCPLTLWEKELRRLAFKKGYKGGFVSNYLGIREDVVNALIGAVAMMTFIMLVIKK